MRREREAIVLSMGVEADERRVCRKEIKKATDKLQCGKAVGVNGITAEMLIHGG